MRTVAENDFVKVDTTNVVAIVNDYMHKHKSTDFITWVILGGNNFMASSPSSTIDFITVSLKKQSVMTLAKVLQVPMKDMAALLNLSYKTLERKKRTDVLSDITSSLSIEIANTISRGLSVFEDSDKLNRWLHKENRALKGKRPFDLLNTPTGIKLVNQILGRIDEGVYT